MRSEFTSVYGTPVAVDNDETDGMDVRITIGSSLDILLSPNVARQMADALIDSATRADGVE